jgi:hypothetical protein
MGTKGKTPEAPLEYATLEQLFAPRESTPSGFPERDLTLEIGGVPRMIRVRAMSRAEALRIRDIDGTAAVEQYLLSTAMLRPIMTQEAVARWQASSLGLEMEPIVDEITELSGLDDEKSAMKSAYRQFEDDPDAEFHSLPGAEVGNDGGPAPVGDAES